MIYVPAKSKADWKNLLAGGDKQWKEGYSAYSLATCWQEASGIPEKVNQVFENANCINLKGAEMLLGIPEYKVALPGRGHESENDLFVLVRTDKELIPVMVEGKVNESFGLLVAD